MPRVIVQGDSVLAAQSIGDSADGCVASEADGLLIGEFKWQDVTPIFAVVDQSSGLFGSFIGETQSVAGSTLTLYNRFLRPSGDPYADSMPYDDAGVVNEDWLALDSAFAASDAANWQTIGSKTPNWLLVVVALRTPETFSQYWTGAFDYQTKQFSFRILESSKQLPGGSQTYDHLVGRVAVVEIEALRVLFDLRVNTSPQARLGVSGEWATVPPVSSVVSRLRTISVDGSARSLIRDLSLSQAPRRSFAFFSAAPHRDIQVEWRTSSGGLLATPADLDSHQYRLPENQQLIHAVRALRGPWNAISDDVRDRMNATEPSSGFTDISSSVIGEGQRWIGQIAARIRNLTPQ